LSKYVMFSLALAIGAAVLVVGCNAASTPSTSAAARSGSGSAIIQLDNTGTMDLLDSGTRVIDVREPSEYRAGHVPGVELVPLATVASAAGSWDKSEPIVIICRSGNRSMQAANTLKDQGFEAVYNVTNGMNGWTGDVLTGDEQGEWPTDDTAEIDTEGHM